jgi:hypothetical protein
MQLAPHASESKRKKKILGKGGAATANFKQSAGFAQRARCAPVAGQRAAPDRRAVATIALGRFE